MNEFPLPIKFYFSVANVCGGLDGASEPVTAIKAVAPPGGGKVLVVFINTMDKDTANGAVIHKMSDAAITALYFFERHMKFFRRKNCTNDLRIIAFAVFTNQMANINDALNRTIDEINLPYRKRVAYFFFSSEQSPTIS